MILNLVLLGFSFEDVLERMTLKQCIALFEFSIATQKIKNKIYAELNFLSNIASISKEGFERFKQFLEEEETSTELEVL